MPLMVFIPSMKPFDVSHLRRADMPSVSVRGFAMIHASHGSISREKASPFFVVFGWQATREPIDSVIILIKCRNFARLTAHGFCRI